MNKEIYVKLFGIILHWEYILEDKFNPSKKEDQAMKKTGNGLSSNCFVCLSFYYFTYQLVPLQ